MSAAYIYIRMEYTFTQLKQKEVIDISNGKNLGKVCDALFSIPENNLLGITVTGGKSFLLARKEIFIPICSVTKVGEDTILVKAEDKNSDKEQKAESVKHECGRHNNCCPPKYDPCNDDCPQKNEKTVHRRSYDEYE